MRAHERGSAGSGASRAKVVIVDVVLVVAATVAYYLVPVTGRMGKDSWIVMFSSGLIVLAVLIVLAIRRMLRAGEVTRIRGLVLLLTLTVLFFSWADKSVAALPGQFASLQTKTDSLYFNMSTLATIGFGDVHAVGQLARAAVTLQIVFNLVFLGTAIAIITGFMRERAKGRIHLRPHPPEQRGATGPESPGPP